MNINIYIHNTAKEEKDKLVQQLILGINEMTVELVFNISI